MPALNLNAENLVVKLNVDDNVIVVKQLQNPVTVTGNTYWNFTGSGATTVIEDAHGNIVDVTIYSPAYTGVSQTVFDSYTGATEVRLQDIETDVLDNYNAITGISATVGVIGIALTDLETAFSGYTGTTAALSTAFSTYTGTTVPALISGFTTPANFIASGITQISTAGNNVTIFVPADSITGVTWSMITGAISGNTNLQAALDAKLDNSVYQSDMLIISNEIDNNYAAFTGYTATTDSTISGIQSDISYLSGQTDLKLVTSTFNAYTGDTAAILTGKTDTSVFNAHTGDSTIHYHQSAITITQSQVQDLVSDLAGKTDTGTTAQIRLDLNTFSGDTLTLYTDTKDKTGFVDGSNINVSYNHANRQITLTGDLSYYWHGEKKTLSSPWTSSAHTATEGAWYLSTVDGTNFTWALNTPWNFYDMQVAFGYYKASSADTFFIKETHCLMDWETHKNLHLNISTTHKSGGGAIAGSYTANTASDSAVSPSFAQAVVLDEDLEVTIPQLDKASGYTLMRVSGGTSIYYTATRPFEAEGVNKYIYVNNPTTGALSAGIGNRYYNVIQILIPVTSDATSQYYRMVFLMPQQTYTSLAAAQAEDTRGLDLGSLGTQSAEYVMYARITYSTSASYTNYGRCVIPTNGISYILGNRGSQVSVSGAISATNHQNLSNLNWLSSGHIAASSFDTLAAFNGTGVAELLPKATYTASGTTQALLSAFNTYTGTTAPASFLPITGLTGYWTSGQTIDYVTGYTPTLTWGNITGSLSAQTDLQTQLDFRLHVSAYNDDMQVLGDVINNNHNAFTGYTATTAPNTYALKSVFNTYTGTTAPLTFAPIVHQHNWNQITGATSGNTVLQSALDLKLDVAVYNDDMQVLSDEIDGNYNIFTGYTATSAQYLIVSGFTASGGTKLNLTDGNLTIYSQAPTGGSATWGSIIGTLANQSDLQSALDDKADTDSLSGYTTTPDFNTYTGTTAPATYFPISGYTFVESGSTEIVQVGNEVTVYTPVMGSIASKDFWNGSQAEYDALGSWDANTIYFIDE